MDVPEPLVTIRSYSAPEFATADREALLEAGIPAYLGGRSYRYQEAVDLRVPESHVTQALAVLGEPRPEEDLLQGAVGPDSNPIRCPLCLSAAVIPQPPYLLWVLLIGFATAGYAFTVRWLLATAVTVVATMVIAARIEQRTPKWRCLRCGHASKDEPRPNDR